MILILKFFLAILEAFSSATAEEPVKYWRQQEKDDSIQDNKLYLCLWPRKTIDTNDTVNMGKKRHFALEMIQEASTFKRCIAALYSSN